VPFVFATAAEGMKRCTIPLTTTELGKRRYRVLLGFAAQPGDKPGQRVFDVKLNGKTVLADFDILKDAGQPDSAVWKEFPLEADGDLVLELVSKHQKPAPGQMPLINGMQVLQE
jgi:hypothetical protein